MKLSVGDVVFVLDKKTHAVVPCQLVEIISSVTLDGETTNHVVVTPTGKKKFKLEDHASPWFSSFDEARSYLLAAATQLIDDTMARALESAKINFNYKKDLKSEEDQDNQLSEDSQEILPISTEEARDHLYVDMAGQRVKVTLPDELANA